MMLSLRGKQSRGICTIKKQGNKIVYPLLRHLRYLRSIRSRSSAHESYVRRVGLTTKEIGSQRTSAFMAVSRLRSTLLTMSVPSTAYKRCRMKDRCVTYCGLTLTIAEDGVSLREELGTQSQ